MAFDEASMVSCMVQELDLLLVVIVRMLENSEYDVVINILIL